MNGVSSLLCSVERRLRGRTSRAQEPGRTYRLAFLLPVARSEPAMVAFFDEMRLHGFVEGQNLAIVPGGFQARNEQIDELVSTLVKAAPDVIVAGGDFGTRALQKATKTIPLIIMTEDVVAAGFAASLAQPGGNITGISLMSPDLDGKRQDILIEAVPHVRRIAALADSNVATLRHLQALEDTARTRGTELLVVRAAKPEDLVPALNDAKARGAGAVNVLSSPMLHLNRRVIIERAADLRLPAIYQWPETAEEGGLLAYGPRFTRIFRQRAQMTIKVLRGAKPADLPVEQPTTFEFVITLKTAKAIGHEVPAGLVLRADKLLE
ncbi:MAG: ABC transporter substrate-binding protein [Pseudolabrys sp.]